jgi:UDPglucose 6-dehydrogenase
METVSVVGIGRLGLCFSLTLERAGYNVLGADVNQDYVDSINSKKFESSEPNVEEYLKSSTAFRATTDLKETIEFSNVLFVVVATPSLANGRYDHSQVDSLVESLISFGPMEETKHLVICCTTMPGYSDTVQSRLENYNYVVSYNPEFIAQGTILRDQLKPDMILIGEGNKEAGDLLEKIYDQMTENDPFVRRMRRTEAEITKISLNCFLTTKIAFANMVGDIAIASECRPQVILNAIGADSRIGLKYLGYGFGYGGPCFPRDNRALAIYADDKNIKALISLASDESNREHLKFQVEEFCKKTKSDLVSFDSVTYKPNTTIVEESQQLEYAVQIAKKGFTVVIKESKEVVKSLKEKFGNLFLYEERDFNEHKK